MFYVFQINGHLGELHPAHDEKFHHQYPHSINIQARASLEEVHFTVAST
jgi:hypothetical protein